MTMSSCKGRSSDRSLRLFCRAPTIRITSADMDCLVLPRSQRCHIRGREWKIIGYLVAESTLKTAARVMKRTDATSGAMLAADSEDEVPAADAGVRGMQPDQAAGAVDRGERFLDLGNNRG